MVDSFVVQNVVNGFDYDSVDGFEDGSVDDSVRDFVVAAAAEH